MAVILDSVLNWSLFRAGGYMAVALGFMKLASFGIS